MRTPDSLLGRQGVTGSPSTRYESALEAERTTTSEFRAALRKGVARLRQKISTSHEGRMLHPQCALEQLYQTFCVNSRETSCPIVALPHLTSASVFATDI